MIVTTDCHRITFSLNKAAFFLYLVTIYFVYFFSNMVALLFHAVFLFKHGRAVMICVSLLRNWLYGISVILMKYTHACLCVSVIRPCFGKFFFLFPAVTIWIRHSLIITRKWLFCWADFINKFSGFSCLCINFSQLHYFLISDFFDGGHVFFWVR